MAEPVIFGPRTKVKQRGNGKQRRYICPGCGAELHRFGYVRQPKANKPGRSYKRPFEKLKIGQSMRFHGTPHELANARQSLRYFHRQHPHIKIKMVKKRFKDFAMFYRLNDRSPEELTPLMAKMLNTPKI